jgi:peptidoglycan/LPS O-acetylase OafA/YrhL
MEGRDQGLTARITYRPELDGIRAVAIAFVLANHLFGGWIGWERAGSLGFVGVTIFFALSGYLITGLLVAERARTGTIGLRSFYLRRVARLAPALAVMLAFVTVVGWLGFTPGPLGTGSAPIWTSEPSWAGLTGALTYTSNWLHVAGFDLGALSPTWTLAVEEQFYLVWPLVLFALPARASAIAVATVVVGIATYVVVPWPTAAFTTTAAAVPLMLGALLAMRGVGSSQLRALSPLAPFGKRAYSLYLWNWPMTALLGPVPGLAATLVMAELSYRLIERPIVARVRARPPIATPVIG